MDFKFGTISIIELGNFISSFLKENGVNTQSQLVIYLNAEEFKKVDEDLFYRNRKNENNEFIPSEGKIVINFDAIKVIINQE